MPAHDSYRSGALLAGAAQPSLVIPLTAEPSTGLYNHMLYNLTVGTPPVQMQVIADLGSGSE